MSDYGDLSIAPFINAVLGKKVKDLIILDVRGLTSVTDVIIVCHGLSTRQVQAVAEHIKIELKKMKILPLSIEGKKEGQWVLLDYGYVVIHVFIESVRSLYDIEGIWPDAKRIELSGRQGNNVAEIKSDSEIIS